MRSEATIPSGVLVSMAERDLSPDARLTVLALLLDPMMPSTGVRQVSTPALSLLTGLSREAVDQALDELEQSGLVGLDHTAGEVWVPWVIDGVCIARRGFGDWKHKIQMELPAIASADLRARVVAYMKPIRS